VIDNGDDVIIEENNLKDTRKEMTQLMIQDNVVINFMTNKSKKFKCK
jgi:hypothetical protein